jgi:hypothetical protein
MRKVIESKCSHFIDLDFVLLVESEISENISKSHVSLWFYTIPNTSRTWRLTLPSALGCGSFDFKITFMTPDF